MGASGCGQDDAAASASAAAATTMTARTDATGRAALTADEQCLDGDPACTPTGAHAGHGAFACSVCHKVAGRLVFDKNGPAYAVGKPAPTFDATAKTCSNVACHGVAAGTYTYTSWDWGLDQPVPTTINYGGTLRTTPSWYTTGAARCTACHDDPPQNGYVWHSGYHGGQGPTGPRNQCQFCHPDASSPGNGIGDTITNPSLHANGTADVQATFTSVCFGCH
jgi:predicted CxxxxCH...CXXCH cytochrome family protein